MPESQDEINEREWNSLINWSGVGYSSKLDTRLWVPKRPMTGEGQALNFGHPQAKFALLAMGMPAIGILIVLTVLFFRR
jgi:uncharacterized membrane protein